MVCGNGATTLVIASVGTSGKQDLLAAELEKVRAAQSAAAAVATDHSFYGDIGSFHRAVAEEVDIGLSVVSCYEFAARWKKRDWASISQDAAIDLLAEQVSRGVDLFTIHASLTREDCASVDQNHRLIPTTSKGGGIIANYIRSTGRENPYFEKFDEVLEVLKAHGTGLSLGTTFRAASVVDQWDGLMQQELSRMGGLAARAQDAGVPVMIEGFGHASLESIPTYIALGHLYCPGAPYRILPMSTDRGLGFDHISGAIATAVAVANGASAVTAMSRAEHVGLPDINDMIEAIEATRVAVVAGELMSKRNFTDEIQMSRTRWLQGCKGDWTVAANPRGAERALESSGRLEDQRIQCSMCGDYCGINAGIAAVNLGPTRLRGS